MILSIPIKEVKVVIGLRGTDEVHIALDTPSPFPEMGYVGFATIQVKKGYGIKWCIEALGVDPKIIDASGER